MPPIMSTLSSAAVIVGGTVFFAILGPQAIWGDLYTFWWKGRHEWYISEGAKAFASFSGLSQEGALKGMTYMWTHYIHNMPLLVAHTFSVIPWFAWPIQFSKTIRRKYPEVHRKVGRVSLLSMIPVCISGLAMGWSSPFGWSSFFLSATTAMYVAYQSIVGWKAIKSKNIPLHELCMTRLSTYLMVIPMTRASFALQTHIMGQLYGPVGDDAAIGFMRNEMAKSFIGQFAVWLAISEGYAMYWRWSRGYGVFGQNWGKGRRVTKDPKSL